jgi:non-heme Fe2+,alpha-ketoglutarate-dependent halogenase
MPLLGRAHLGLLDSTPRQRDASGEALPGHRRKTRAMEENQVPKLLNEEQIARYRERGYHFPIDALSAAEVAAFRRRLEDYEASSGGPIKAEIRHRSHVLFPWIDEMIRHPKILDAIEDVLGPNILCWNTSFFNKEAHDPGFVSWHQDATYWGLSSSDVATAWIAMSPANKISGCMKFIAGTHKSQVKHEDTFDQNNLLTRGQEIAVEVDEADAVYVELEPGQASLHHVLLFHGSEPNRSDERRIGLAVRYIPTHLKQAVGQRDWATLVRGKDSYRNFEPAHVPKRELEPEALAFHQMVSEEQVKVLYRGTGKTAYRA